MPIDQQVLIVNDHPILALVVFVIALYGAYENLIRKRLSLFGIDRLGYSIAYLFNQNIASKARKNLKALQRVGFMQLLIALGIIVYSIRIR